MDGDSTSPRPDMRKTVGLGTCNCCDYFNVKNNTIVLIEETQLMEMIKNLKKEYHYLKKRERRKFIYKCIIQENKLKFYGSMLVLCRLDTLCNDAKPLLKKKRYDFWLVVSGPYKAKYSKTFLYLQKRLSGSLGGSMGKMMNAVKVIPAHKLAAKLSGNINTP